MMCDKLSGQLYQQKPVFISLVSLLYQKKKELTSNKLSRVTHRMHSNAVTQPVID